MSKLRTNQRATSQGVSALAATRVMEAETISKNAARPKSQMIRGDIVSEGGDVKTIL